MRNRLKNDRTKETAVLKQVVKLSQTNAANANGALEEQLIKNGYKKEEVIFLNGILTGARRYLDPNSLTAEKIAVRVLKTFLPGEKMYPDVVYELCETFLRKYDCFPVRSVAGKNPKLPVWNEGGKCPDFLNAVSFSKKWDERVALY